MKYFASNLSWRLSINYESANFIFDNFSNSPLVRRNYWETIAHSLNINYSKCFAIIIGWENEYITAYEKFCFIFASDLPWEDKKFNKFIFNNIRKNIIFEALGTKGSS